MRIGELAKAVGIAPSALRYYEGAGLLDAAKRTASGYRIYGPAALGRVQFIQRAQALGLSVGEIRRLVESPTASSAAQRRALRHVVAHKLAQTKNRAVQLSRLQHELEALYVRLDRAPAPECGHLGDCACWLPTEEEVIKMEEEVVATEACTCCGCTEAGCDCGCDCCGQDK